MSASQSSSVSHTIQNGFASLPATKAKSIALTPSLLPRGPLFQGLVSGAAGAIGYGLGVFIVWLVRYMASRESSARPPRWAWRVLVVVGIIGQVLMIIWFHVWQDDVRDLPVT